jgi:hypothetical protein
LILFLALQSNAQDDPYEIEKYDFINSDTNKLCIFGDTANFNKLFLSLNNLILKGEGQIKILHIGDSHLQADYFSGRMRQRLQTFFKGGQGGRGFIFPYRVANTNNPFNLRTDFTGTWESCKNIDKSKICDLGISGISVTTYDSISGINIFLRDKDYIKYDFNRIIVFHNTDTLSFDISISTKFDSVTVLRNDSLGYTSFTFNKYIDDTLKLNFIKTKSSQSRFVLHGISFETDDPGIIYHSVGVNGADVDAFLRCVYFSNHLKALNPDLVIISLGTNDGYMKVIDSAQVSRDFSTLLVKTKNILPGIPVLLTTPGDSYRYKRYLNENIPKIREIIFDQAEKYNFAVWDFFSVMGGLNSITLWYKANLTAKDKLHLNAKGYILQGDLMFNAFLKAYDQFIDKNDKE